MDNNFSFAHDIIKKRLIILGCMNELRYSFALFQKIINLKNVGKQKELKMVEWTLSESKYMWKIRFIMPFLFQNLKNT